MNIITPNMSLIVPSVGNEPSPTYAFDINTSLTLIDQHTHTPGSGVQITPAAININAALNYNTNFAIGLAGLTLTPALSTPAINTVYESGVDLYYVDGLGNNVRITQSGGIAGSPGSIANLTSPASASYVAGNRTFVWQSGTTIAANLDAASIILRNISPNSTFGLTLSAPAALSNDYSITLPSIPVQTNILQMDTSGTITASVNVDNSTLQLAGNNLSIKNNGVTAAQIANGTITTTQISNSAGILGGQIANNTITAAQIYSAANINGGQIGSGTLTLSNIAASAIDQGLYTPSVTNRSSTMSLISISPCQYMKVGNTVTVSGIITYFSSAGPLVSCTLSLPIGNAFGASYQAAGTAAADDGSGTVGAVNGVAGSALVWLKMGNPNPGPTTIVSFTFTYRQQ